MLGAPELKAEHEANKAQTKIASVFMAARVVSAGDCFLDYTLLPFLL